MIEFDSVSYYYKNHGKPEQALDGLSFTVGVGEFVSLAGPIGCGKSTAARLINALAVPDSGKVFIDGLDTSDAANTEQIRKKSGFVFQNPLNQIVSETVEDEVAFGLENMGLERDETERRVTLTLKDLGLEDLRYRNISSLSGGQLQKVCCASVVSMESRYIVLDEALSMLDDKDRISFMKTLCNLCRERGTGIVNITHSLDECLFSEKIIIMKNGKAVFNGGISTALEKKTVIEDAGLEYPVIAKITDALGLPVCLSAAELAGYLKKG